MGVIWKINLQQKKTTTYKWQFFLFTFVFVFFTVCESCMVAYASQRRKITFFLLAFIHFLSSCCYFYKRILSYMWKFQLPSYTGVAILYSNIFLKFPHAWAILISYFPLNRFIHRVKVRWKKANNKKFYLQSLPNISCSF